MKILIIKPSSFGDIIQANPVAQALVRTYPDAKISWLVFDVWAEVINFFTPVTHTIVWKKRGGIAEFLRVVRAVRTEKFDLVIDLQGLARTGLLSFLSGGKTRIGVPGLKECSWLLEKEVFPEQAHTNAIMRNLAAVRYLTGTTHPADFAITIPDALTAETRRIIETAGVTPLDTLIALIPSSRGRGKEWPVEHFRSLNTLIFKNIPRAKILMIGGKGDFYVFSAKGVVSLCGTTSLSQLFALLNRCAVVVGPDTGPLHLAAALGVPCVVLFGGSDVTETSPVSPKVSIVHKPFPCQPCRGKPRCADNACLVAITPEEVLTEIQKWL